MLRTSLRLRWMGGLAALAVMVTLAACGTGSAMPAGLTPAGFLLGQEVPHAARGL